MVVRLIKLPRPTIPRATRLLGAGFPSTDLGASRFNTLGFPDSWPHRSAAPAVHSVNRGVPGPKLGRPYFKLASYSSHVSNPPRGRIGAPQDPTARIRLPNCRWGALCFRITRPLCLSHLTAKAQT